MMSTARRLVCLSLFALCLGCADKQKAAPQAPAEEAEAVKPDGLTDAQWKAGWKLLFDGKSPEGWRGFRRERFPAGGWKVEDGTLRCVAGGGGGDIVTVGQYQDFELKLEFKVAPQANSGIMYRVGEKDREPWHSAPEFQVLDDKGCGAKPTDGHSVGAMYDLYSPPADKPVKPAGEWNKARVVMRDGKVQHWLNDMLLVECDYKSADFKRRVAGSKFNAYSNFARLKKGHIDLQDHGNDVWYRNIMVRDLTPKPGQEEIALFNGKDLEGWDRFPAGDEAKDVWSVQEGILVCAGKPTGYLYTKEKYTSFYLRLQCRFDPATKKTGNGGLLIRQVGVHKVWPRSIEIQLQGNNIGDFWNIDKFPMKVVEERTQGRNTKKTHFNEVPPGQWNTVETIADGRKVTVIVNGEVLNEAWDCAEWAGPICLQSEGTPMHFRDIALIPLGK